MFFNKPSTNSATTSSNNMADQAAMSADHAIHATQSAANAALDGMVDAAQTAHDQAAPILNRASERASAMAHRGADALRNGSQQLRDQAARASDSTVGYIKTEPVKAMLIAAATGAALMALISLVNHNRHRG